VPEAAWPVLLDHLDDLGVWPEKIVDFPAHEAPPVGSLGDMPGPTSLAEKPELRSEDGQDVKTLWLQDSQDAGQVLEPIRLFLVMKTTVVQDDIEGGVCKGERENVRPAESDVLPPAPWKIWPHAALRSGKSDFEPRVLWRQLFR